MSLIQTHPLSIIDLRKEMRKRKADIDEKKKSCKILIIDDHVNDEDYPLKDSIVYLRRTLMMDVRTVTDLDSFNEAANYDIIISDVEGVGGKMGLPNGIDLIKRLNELYKDKLYAIMSQELFQFRSLKMGKEVGIWDKKEMKEAFRCSTSGTLEERVLKMVDTYADPAARWEVLRAGMLKNGMSIHDVAKLESAYVKSILNKDRSIYDKTVGKLDSPVYDNEERILNYIKTAASIISTIISLI